MALPLLAISSPCDPEVKRKEIETVSIVSPLLPIKHLSSPADERKKIDATIIGQKGIREENTILSSEWGTYLKEKEIGRHSSLGLEPTPRLVALLTVKNDMDQTLLYTLFRFGTVSTITQVCDSFLGSMHTNVRDVYKAALTTRNEDKMKDLPLAGLCFRDNFSKQLSRMQILDLAERFTPPTIRNDAMVPIDLMLKGFDLGDFSHVAKYTSSESWVDPQLVAPENKADAAHPARDAILAIASAAKNNIDSITWEVTSTKISDVPTYGRRGQAIYLHKDWYVDTATTFSNFIKYRLVKLVKATLDDYNKLHSDLGFAIGQPTVSSIEYSFGIVFYAGKRGIPGFDIDHDNARVGFKILVTDTSAAAPTKPMEVSKKVPVQMYEFTLYATLQSEKDSSVGILSRPIQIDDDSITDEYAAKREAMDRLGKIRVKWSASDVHSTDKVEVARPAENTQSQMYHPHTLP